MKYRILDLKNYESIVDEYLEVFADEFDYDSSKEMVKERKKQFIEFIKPIFINEVENELNENPEILNESFENKGNGVYVSDTGVEFVLKEEK